MKYYLAEKATVYSEPNPTSPVVAELQATDEIEVAEPTSPASEGWDAVRLLDGKSGYISAKTKGRTRPISQPSRQSGKSSSWRSAAGGLVLVFAALLSLLLCVVNSGNASVANLMLVPLGLFAAVQAFRRERKQGMVSAVILAILAALCYLAFPAIGWALVCICGIVGCLLLKAPTYQ